MLTIRLSTQTRKKAQAKLKVNDLCSLRSHLCNTKNAYMHATYLTDTIVPKGTLSSYNAHHKTTLTRNKARAKLTVNAFEKERTKGLLSFPYKLYL